MPIEQLNTNLSLVSGSLDSFVNNVKDSIQNAISVTDADKILMKIKEQEQSMNLLNDSANEIIENSKMSNVNLSYETKFLKSIVGEYANSSNMILNSESTINQYIMQQDILQTDNIMNTANEDVQTESKGFFKRLANRIAAAQRRIMEGIRGILKGEGTVIQKVANMLGVILSGIFSTIAETFSPLIMTIASGFLHITGSFTDALDFDEDTFFTKMISSGQKLQEKLIAQKPIWEEMESMEEKE